MASSLHQWESDPLFSAAEVVQDSADRMDSIFHYLLHELSVVQHDCPDPKLHASVDYHKRDLATTLETVKWQLQDFERAVSLSAMTGESRMRGDVISRHKQFIRAIREQIVCVEKSLEGTSIGDPVRNTEWVKLNEQDRDGLALFLSGGNATEHSDSNDAEDSDMFKRFLDPTTTSSAKDSSSRIVEHKIREFENLNMNGVMQVDHSNDSKKAKNLRKVSSYPNTRLGFEVADSFPATSSNRYGEIDSWDLEAVEAKPERFFYENKLRGFCRRINESRIVNNIWTLYGSRFTRNYTKRFKDGEEQSHSPSHADVSHAPQVRTKMMYLQTWLDVIRTRYQRSPFQVQMHAVQLVLLVLLIVLGLIILGILVFRFV